MDWYFASRNGQLTISHFDNHSFTAGGLTQIPGVNQFKGAFDNLPNSGVVGSFANNGTVKAGGVLGNFYVNQNSYKASGIFAGSGTPHHP